MNKKAVQRKSAKKMGSLIGDYLKNKREGLGVELRLISQKTRINYKILEKLESNRFEELPNKTYIRGFCQIYAKELGIDVEEVMDVLNNSYESQEPHVEKNSSEQPVDDSPSFDFQSLLKGFKEKNSHLSSIIMAISSLLVVVIFFFAVKMLFTDKETSKPANMTTKEQEVIQPKKAETPATKIEVSSASPVEITESEIAQPAKVEVVKTPIAVATPVPTPATTPKPVITAKPTPIPTIAKKPKIDANNPITFRPMALELYSVVKNAPEIKDESIFPKRYRSVVRGKQNVFVHAITGDTWLTYKKDGFPIKKFTLKQGRMVMIRGDEVLLFLGNVNVAKIFLNGQLLNTPSSSGVKSMVFPEDLASEYHIPLFPRDKNGTAYTSKEFRSNEGLE